MATRRWTRDELIALAQGREITARDLHAGEVDPPAWLLAHAKGRYPYNSKQSTELIHPEDRNILIESFLTCAGRPGEPLVYRMRSRSGGYWHHGETTWVNLIDDEDVGSLLAFIRTVDGPPVVPPDDEMVGEHTATNWMVWNLSETGHITSAEGAAELLGYEPAELVGHHPTDFLPADSVADGIAMWVELHEKPGNTATNCRPWVRRDGSRIWIEDSYLNRPGHEGEDAVLVVLWDATARRAQEQALRDREEQLVAREAEKSALAAQMEALARDFRMLADEVPAAVFRCDTKGVVLFNNARWEELLDGEGGVARLHDLIDPTDHPALEHALAELAHAESDQRRSLEVADHGGDRMWRVSLRAMGDGDRSSLIGSIEDVSATVKLRREARHDTLTGLLNRPGVEEHLKSAITTGSGYAGVLVLFVDLDGFKGVNDTFGHDAGDAVLAEVAQRLNAGLRPDDVVGRYGGDEFVIVCHDAGAAEASHIVDRLTIALGGPIAFTGGSWQPQASIGAARAMPGDDVAAVLRRADLAMFDRKRVRAQGSRGQ